MTSLQSTWVRTCQSCGHKQVDTKPEYGKAVTVAYENRKCKVCKSESLDYGSERAAPSANGKDEADTTALEAHMSQKKWISISVAGPPGIGKSTILQLIANTLESHGIESQFRGTVTVRAPELLRTSATAIAKTSQVMLTEIRPRRAADGLAEPKEGDHG